jgi:hypothetical protein
MALYLSSDLSSTGGGGSGSGDITTLIRSSTSWYFHALRRDSEGMLFYDTLRPTDSGTIDVFNEANFQLTDLLDGVDNVEAKAPILEISLISGGTKLVSESNAVYVVSNLESFKGTGKKLSVKIYRDSTGVISNIEILNPGENFAENDDIIVSSTFIKEEKSQSDLVLRVTKLVKQYTNTPSDKYQQYRFDMRKISYYIDDQGYLVAKFGNHDYSQGPR